MACPLTWPAPCPWRRLPRLQSWHQVVCWTQAELPAAIKRRDHQLRRAHFALSVWRDRRGRARKARRFMRQLAEAGQLPSWFGAAPAGTAPGGGEAAEPAAEEQLVEGSGKTDLEEQQEEQQEDQQEEQQPDPPPASPASVATAGGGGELGGSEPVASNDPTGSNEPAGSSIGMPPAKKQKLHKPGAQRGIHSEWFKDRPWLGQHGSSVFCHACSSSKTKPVMLQNKLDTINKHATSEVRTARTQGCGGLAQSRPFSASRSCL